MIDKAAEITPPVDRTYDPKGYRDWSRSPKVDLKDYILPKNKSDEKIPELVLDPDKDKLIPKIPLRNRFDEKIPPQIRST